MPRKEEHRAATVADILASRSKRSAIEPRWQKYSRPPDAPGGSPSPNSVRRKWRTIIPMNRPQAPIPPIEDR